MSERKCPICGEGMYDNGAGWRCKNFGCPSISTIPYHYTPYTDRVAAERDAAIKEVGVWSRKCGLLEVENERLNIEHRAILDIVNYYAEFGKLPTPEVQLPELAERLYLYWVDYETVIGNVFAENAELRKRIEELESKKEQYLKMIVNFTGNA